MKLAQQTEISITKDMYQSALQEASKRIHYTSRRHDYHDGSQEARLEKFFAGLLGESCFKKYILQQGFSCGVEVRRADQPDRADLWIRRNGKSFSVNVKTELPGRRRFQETLLVTLEEIEKKRPCDLYVAVKLKKMDGRFATGQIMGLATLDQVKAAPVVNGFQENYAVTYEELQLV